MSVSLYDTFLFVLKTGFVGSPLKSYKIICQRGVKIIKQTNACCSISTWYSICPTIFTGWLTRRILILSICTRHTITGSEISSWWTRYWQKTKHCSTEKQFLENSLCKTMITITLVELKKKIKILIFLLRKEWSLIY